MAEIAAGLAMLAFASVVIQDDSRLWMLAFIFFLTRLCSTAYLMRRVWNETGLGWCSFFVFSSGVRYLRCGFNFFIFQAAVSLYTSFNVVLLGLFRTPAEVGAYASAERLIKAGLGFIGQASQALFARLNHLKMTSVADMERLRSRALAGMFLLGMLGSVIILALADFVAQYLFPATADDVASMLRIFAMLVPAIALSSVLGLHYLIVDKQEVLFNRIIITAALTNLIAATAAIQFFGARGLAVSWVLIEWIITLLIACSIVWIKKNVTNLEKPEHV
jgi:PST family polysaccharide transporter